MKTGPHLKPRPIKLSTDPALEIFSGEGASTRGSLEGGDTVVRTSSLQDLRNLTLVDLGGFNLRFYKRLPETGVSHEDADKYLAQNGKSAPVFVKGATIEEAAKAAGVNAENLKATVAKYNAFVKAKKDADFGRPVQYMKAEISAEGPYYLVEQKPRFATTMGGVCTNDKLNLVNTDGSVIPNLYGAGELVGGVMGDDSPAGANVGWALTSGRVAADAIAEAIKAGK